MTSNLGSDLIQAATNVEDVRDAIDTLLKATFKPEFLNRIDDIITFNRLSREDISRIVELQVAQLSERISERGIAIELTDEARTLLGNLGDDPVYGARPLKRVIQRQLVDKLALKLLEGGVLGGRRDQGGRRRRRPHLREGRRAGHRGGGLAFLKLACSLSSAERLAHRAS